MEFLDKAVKYTPYIGVMMLGGVLAFSAFERNKDYSEEVISYEKDVEDTKSKNKDLYKAYEDYIEVVSSSIKNRCDDRNLVNDFAYYVTMLNRGYFSLGNNFEYESVENSYYDLQGISIALGVGNIENETAHLVDVLNSLGYDARYVVGTLNKGEDYNYVMCAVDWCSTTFILDVAHKDIYLKSGNKEYESIVASESVFIPADSYFDYEVGENNNEDLYKVDKVNSKTKKQILTDFKEFLNEAPKHIAYFRSYENISINDNEEEIDSLVTINDDSVLIRK